MNEDLLPSTVPAFLQKDLVSTRHEVPVAKGRSHTVQENYYTPRLMRWAVDQWFASVPDATDLVALQQSLRVACADTSTFHAYLQVPEAFAEIYQEEVGKRHLYRAEVDSVKRVLDAGSKRHMSGWYFLLGSALFAATAIVTVAFLR
jgi:hypothetical protein